MYASVSKKLVEHALTTEAVSVLTDAAVSMDTRAISVNIQPVMVLVQLILQCVVDGASVQNQILVLVVLLVGLDQIVRFQPVTQFLHPIVLLALEMVLVFNQTLASANLDILVLIVKLKMISVRKHISWFRPLMKVVIKLLP